MNELEAAIKRAKMARDFRVTTNIPAILAEEMDPEPPKQIYPKVIDIKRAVADYFSVEVHDLDCNCRGAAVIRPRHIAMYLCRRLTLHSLPEIGRRFGGRDHTTVKHACDKMAKRLENDRAEGKELRAEVEEIKALIRARVANGQA
jgi:chromosomal replication initiator protein